MAHYDTFAIMNILQDELNELDERNESAALNRMTQTHPLFKIPELVHCLLMQVNSPKLLARCARVNRLWSQEALAILWRGDTRTGSEWRTPELGVLAHLASRHRDRFMYYVGKIRYLTIFPDPQSPPRFVNPDILFNRDLWKQFRGRYVKLNIEYQTLRERHVRSLFNWKLKELFLVNADYSESLLDHLKVR